MEINKQSITKTFKEAYFDFNNGEFLSAKIKLEKIIQIQHRSVEALQLLGVIYATERDFTNAITFFSKAVKLSPASAQLLFNRGNAYYEFGKYQEAIKDLEKSLLINHQNINALVLYGNIKKECDHKQEAIEIYDKALNINGYHYEALVNKACALIDLADYKNALELLQISIKVEPNLPQAYSNRGNALLSLNKLQDAVESYEMAIAIYPDYSDAYFNLGNALQRLMRFEESIMRYEKAIQINPSSADAYLNCGNALLKIRRLDEALLSYKKALEIDPNVKEVIYHYVLAKMSVCNWSALSHEVDKLTDSVLSNKVVVEPFTLLNLTDKVEILKQASEFFSARKFPINDSLGPLPPRQLGGKTKIAFLSADFSEHPMGYNFVGFFENLDRSKFEVIAVSFIQVSDSPLFQRLVAAFDVFKMVDKLADSEVCQWMREQQIDIAVDMMGPTLNNRQGIFAMRCAPVQVNQFSWTSGAPYMDYIIADPVSMPKEYAAGYSEKLAYVPHTLFATDDKREVAEKTPQRSEENLPEQGIVFCCFNNSHKITPEVFDVWMRVLQKVPNSVLWIRSAGDSMEKNLNEEAKSRGVDPKRLVFAARVPSMKEHLARYRLADLFLDTFPFCAQTTASDALWAGVPVVTCVGESSMSRICASLLHALDMPELVTGSLQEYEGKVLELAKDRAKIQEVRKKLQVQKAVAPLFNTALYTRNIENAYRDMLKVHKGAEN